MNRKVILIIRLFLKKILYCYLGVFIFRREGVREGGIFFLIFKKFDVLDIKN